MAEAKTVKTKAKKATTVAEKAPKTPRAPKAEKTGEFAIFATGGKQYRVSPGDSLKIEKIIGEHKEGDKIVFDKVLLVGDGSTEATIGTPYISGAKVNTTLKKIGRYKTIDVIKYKQKSRYFKKNGHRQPYFEVTIDSIK
ncbi:MAG: ribosomal protein L21 [Parcubacteria bacterium C7867-005]|nr:MAG: ribosomal protein L21 [Parcubacteria bacterium C7867-005]